MANSSRVNERVLILLETDTPHSTRFTLVDAVSLKASPKCTDSSAAPSLPSM